jgi:hypothetical protein
MDKAFVPPAGDKPEIELRFGGFGQVSFVKVEVFFAL